MIKIDKRLLKPHKANAIDRRAIHNLISHLQWRVEDARINININDLIDETSYKIINIDGYENIVFYDDVNNAIFEIVQPFDRENNKLFPIQEIELKVIYKRI